jgi:hypothetical protein
MSEREWGEAWRDSIWEHLVTTGQVQESDGEPVKLEAQKVSVTLPVTCDQMMDMGVHPGNCPHRHVELTFMPLKRRPWWVRVRVALSWKWLDFREWLGHKIAGHSCGGCE